MPQFLREKTPVPADLAEQVKAARTNLLNHEASLDTGEQGTIVDVHPAGWVIDQPTSRSGSSQNT